MTPRDYQRNYKTDLLQLAMGWIFLLLVASFVLVAPLDNYDFSGRRGRLAEWLIDHLGGNFQKFAFMVIDLRDRCSPFLLQV